MQPNEENLAKFNEEVRKCYLEWASAEASLTKEDLDQKVEALQTAMKSAAESHVEKKPLKAEDTARSPELEE